MNIISDERLKNVDDESLRKVIGDFEKVGLNIALQQGFSLDYYYMAKELLSARQTIKKQGDLLLETMQIIPVRDQIIADQSALIGELVADGEELASHCPPRGTDGYTTNCDRALDSHRALLKKMEVKG